MSFKSLAGFVLLGLAWTTHAAIGPVTNLHITNVDIQPDGFTRPAVLAEGVFPGPLIKGNKVSFYCATNAFAHNCGWNFLGGPLSDQCHRSTDQRGHVEVYFDCK